MRAERLIALLMKLQRHSHANAPEFARQLNVSVRTIYRDIDTLSAMGVPVFAEPGRGGGIRLLDRYRSDLTGLSAKEVEALALVASPGSNTTQSTRGQSVLDKLAAAVPAIHQQAAKHARDRLLFDTKPWFRAPDNSPFLEELRDCVWNDETIEIDYLRSDAAQLSYRIDPLALVIKVDTWYLVARLRKGATMRVFRVSRVQALRRGDCNFQRDPAFDLGRFWRDWCERFERSPPGSYPTRLRLTRAGLNALKEGHYGWFRAQIDAAGTKRGKIEMDLDFELPHIAVGILFPLGDDVEVIEPKSLRENLNKLARRVMHASA